MSNRWPLRVCGTPGRTGKATGLQSFAIVTTKANKLMSRIIPHARHPAIRDYDRWLDREETERLPLHLLRSLD